MSPSADVTERHAPDPPARTKRGTPIELLIGPESLVEASASCIFPLEIVGHVARYADLESLKNLSLTSRPLRSEAARHLWRAVLFESSHPERFFIMQQYAHIVQDVQLCFTCDYHESGDENFSLCENMLSILFSLPRLRTLHLLVSIPSSDHKTECRIFAYLLEADFSRFPPLRHLTLSGVLHQIHQRELVPKLVTQLPSLEVLDLKNAYRDHVEHFKPGMLPRLSRLYAATMEDVSAAVGSSLEHLTVSCGHIDSEKLETLMSFISTSLDSLETIQISGSGGLGSLIQIFKYMASLPRLRQLYISFYLPIYPVLPSRLVDPIISGIESSKSSGGLRQLSQLSLVCPSFEKEDGKQFIRRCFDILGPALNSVEIRRTRRSRRPPKVLLGRKDDSGNIIFPVVV
ncbi:hypothetical protein DL93DRAFT_2084684 [Clavulina sp. PMI_390]|nr:hypothetical protein DL93DRAFT_2084684 [Clavulina sp. PMI_390]